MELTHILPILYFNFSVLTLLLSLRVLFKAGATKLYWIGLRNTGLRIGSLARSRKSVKNKSDWETIPDLVERLHYFHLLALLTMSYSLKFNVWSLMRMLHSNKHDFHTFFAHWQDEIDNIFCRSTKYKL